jgi:hypothetical protein
VSGCARQRSCPNPTLARRFQEEYRYAPTAGPVVRPLLLKNYKQETIVSGGSTWTSIAPR